MASTLLPLSLIIILALTLTLTLTRASFADISIYDDVDAIAMDDEGLSLSSGRSLLWRSMRYYISYGALWANRVPCPPRSGRSYYTHNCWRATGPVRPYTRGCSTITRCRR
ncbi:hypothetical protein L1987_71618 [Smallanthus sonchifolius]|uniref:Uncharacterized protein n=1 Tax=Smallanthus sonchifolius TaxID=185202 RepID=A0ACB9ATK0_9ASTR|nr:hypothetical protein L1987_71618 [Smallanthus sonchifolius]